MKTPPFIGAALFGLILGWLTASPAHAQMLESFQRLDTNGNGLIEPHEWNPRAKAFVQRFAARYGVNLDQPQTVTRLNQIATIYFATRPATTAPPTPSLLPPSTIKGFEPETAEVAVPGFTASQLRIPYTQADMTEASGVLRQFDRNRDGVLTSEELFPNRWTPPGPEATDLDGDGRITLEELAQRSARIRLEREQRNLASQFTEMANTGIVASSATGDPNEAGGFNRGRGRWGADRGSRGLAMSIIQRYDLDRNGTLEAREMTAVGMPISDIDLNRDGRVDPFELGQYLFQEMEREGNDFSELLPSWFYERDANNDGQIEMAEFADEWTAEKAEEFALFDANGDGIITTDEILNSRQLVGGQYANQEAQLMLPRSVVVSEIVVEENAVIGDLNIQLSITHTSVGDLDGYLITPAGDRIELFAAVGGGGDHFDQTTFDDEASTSITRAQAPFNGSFQPGGLAKRQPGLASLNGKNVQGVWQLMIRCSRSERAGVLHDWALIVSPDRTAVDQMLDAPVAAAPESDNDESDNDGPSGDSGDPAESAAAAGNSTATGQAASQAAERRGPPRNRSSRGPRP